MNLQTIRLRAILDQHLAHLRDQVAGATVALGRTATAEADSVVDKYFGGLLAADDEQLLDQLDPEFVPFLLRAGVIQRAELEADRAGAGE